MNLTGRISLVILDTDDSTQLGVAVRVVSAWTERAVNEVGQFEVRIAASDPAVALAETGRYVRLYQEGHGIRFRGLIEGVEFVEVERDGLLAVVSGGSLAQEFVYENAYVGMLADGETPADALTALLADDAPAWTPTVTGTYANTVTQRPDNMGLWEAAVKLAELANGYLRETNTPREVELKNTYSSSGLVLSNLSALGPMLSEDASVIPILSLPRYRRDGRGIYNRIVPYGRSQVDSLTLRDSTRSSPYTIQTLQRGLPRVTAIAQAESSAPAQASTTSIRHRVEIEVSGVNRLLLVHAATQSGGGRHIAYAEVNGKRLNNIDWAFRSTGQASLYFLVNPPLGRVAVEVASDSDSTINVRVTVVALENASQLANPFRNSSGAFDDVSQTLTSGIATGNSTSPSVSPASAVSDLVLDFVWWNGNTLTVGAGQTQLQNETDAPRAAVSQEPGSASSTTMSWTISSSAHWIQMAVSILPALTYYIEDSASVAAHHRRVLPLVNIDLSAYDIDDPVALANALYDYAVNVMLKHKDEVEFAERVEVPWLPDDLLPGDSARLLYQGIVETVEGRFTTLDADATVIFMRLREVYDRDGARRWLVNLATALRPPDSNGEVATDNLINIAGLKRAQVSA